MSKMQNITPSMRMRVLDYVLETTGVSRADLISSSIKGGLVEARALYVWLIRQYIPQAKLATIGIWLGGRAGNTIENSHLRAMQLRLHNADFELWCEQFDAFQRSEGNLHACA